MPVELAVSLPESPTANVTEVAAFNTAFALLAISV